MVDRMLPDCNRIMNALLHGGRMAEKIASVPAAMQAVNEASQEPDFDELALSVVLSMH
jgi:hypothetical protein